MLVPGENANSRSHGDRPEVRLGRGKRAFTLIELLVVIAVIAILASLLLPAISSTLKRARAIKCVSNLRQMGYATFMYADQNDDRLPFAWIDDPDPSVNSFYALLMPELYGTEFDGFGDFQIDLYSCPARAKEPLVGDNPMRVSYGMNAFNSAEWPSPRTRRMTQAQGSDASVKVLIADIAFTHNHPPILSLQTNRLGYKHAAKANILFFDGHVAAHSLQQTNGLVVYP
jgi:prepilin-type N-terminal cleavage/methylation domain-containing protein/prepilin-type processing-associated H-X9-DG protein